jgi:fatty acid desaturase
MFNKEQRRAVVMSNMGLLAMGIILYNLSKRFGATVVLRFYGIPWLLVTHWFIMITYLHHTDPRLPHYRKGAWNFQRGAAATIDRDFLGWQGRFFLHDGSFVIHRGEIPTYTRVQSRITMSSTISSR